MPGGEAMAREQQDSRGDNTGHAGGWAVAAPPHQTDGGRRERQLGDGGRQEELAERLRPADVPRLAHPQLQQPRQSVLGHLPPSTIGGEGRAALEGPRLLEQGLRSAPGPPNTHR